MTRSLSPAMELAKGTGTQWIVDMVEDMIAHVFHEDIYSNAAAMGLIMKYKPRLSLWSPDQDKEKAWMIGLSDERLEELDRLSSAHATGLISDLDAIGLGDYNCPREACPKDLSWRKRLVRLCQERDLLDGVQALFKVAVFLGGECGGRLNSTLGLLDDEMGERLLKVFNFHPRPYRDFQSIEHLLMSAVRCPDSWWSMYASLLHGYLVTYKVTFVEGYSGNLPRYETVWFDIDDICIVEESKKSYCVSQFVGTLEQVEFRCKEISRMLQDQEGLDCCWRRYFGEQ